MKEHPCTQVLGAEIVRAVPMWLIGDMTPDQITLRVIDRYQMRRGQPSKVFGWLDDDAEALDFIERNVKIGSIYELDQDDLLRGAGFTHSLTVWNPTDNPSDEEYLNCYVVQLETP